MAGPGKLTDAAVLHLIQQTLRVPTKQCADCNEQETHNHSKENENVTEHQNASEKLPVEKVETGKAAVQSVGQVDSNWQVEAHSLPVLTAELQSESLLNVTSIAKQAVDFDVTYPQQAIHSEDKNLADYELLSSVKSSLQTVSHSNITSPCKEMSKFSESSSLKTVTMSNVTSPFKEMSQFSVKPSQKPESQSNLIAPLKDVSQSEVITSKTDSQYCVTSPVKGTLTQCNVTSQVKIVGLCDVASPVKEVSQTHVSSPVKQITDSESMSPDGSVSQVDVTSYKHPYRIDAELVSMLSEEEIKNLVHGYRTELESSKKKLERSERQLAKANNYNDVLRNMVEKLSSEIHRLKHRKTCSVHVQVDKEDFLEYTTGRGSMPNWHTEEEHSSVPMDTSLTEEAVVITDSTIPQQPTEEETETLSIADSIKQAAEAVVQKQQADMLHDNGYVYDEHSGLYYHSATGYYYDQQKSLFYDPKTGVYYYYDYDTGEYVFHSQVELPSQTQAAEQSSVTVDFPIKKKYSDAKKSRKIPKTKKVGERHSSKERVYKNRRERRKAEQEKSHRKERQNREDKYGRGHSRERERKRRRYNNYSCTSESSRSRSRTSSRDRGQRNSVSQGRDIRSPVSCHRTNRSRKTRTRNSRSEKRYRNRKRCMGSESHSAESDVLIIEDNEIEKFKEMKCRTKSLDNLDSRTKSKRSGDTSKRSKSEEFVKSSKEGESGIVQDIECEDSDIGNRANFLLLNTAEEYELESENDLMIIEDETVDNKNEVMDAQNARKNIIDTKDAHKESGATCKMETKEECMYGHSKRNKSSRHSHRRSRSRKRSKNYHIKSKSKDKSRKETRQIEGSGSETESGELSDTDSEYSSYSKSYSSYSNVSEEDLYVDLVESDEQEETEVAGSYPPCIRMMVVESDCLAIGSLFIVTCTGAKIGRENCDICIPDLNVSKIHAEIYYNESSNKYEIFDNASQNGTYLNSHRLSPAKKASEPFVVCHDDSLLINTTKILCHIHPGSDTCDQCEPGVVIATNKAQQQPTELKVLSKEARLRQKKQEMNQIKKKYGLKNSAYENNPEVFNNPNYTDKAAERRKHVGSDVPGQKTEAPASVHRPISTGNVGHKLLQKMGWKEGDSLGKNNTGIQEPISVTLRASQKAGLGSASATGFSADDANTVDIKKATRRIQAQQRYKQIDSGNS